MKWRQIFQPFEFPKCNCTLSLQASPGCMFSILFISHNYDDKMHRPLQLGGQVEKMYLILSSGNFRL